MDNVVTLADRRRPPAQPRVSLTPYCTEMVDALNAATNRGTPCAVRRAALLEMLGSFTLERDDQIALERDPRTLPPDRDSAAAAIGSLLAWIDATAFAICLVEDQIIAGNDVTGYLSHKPATPGGAG